MKFGRAQTRYTSFNQEVNDTDLLLDLHLGGSWDE